MKPVIGITITTRQGFVDYYVHAIARAGGSPLVLPVLGDSEAAFPVLERLDGIVFSGGSDVNPSFYHENPKKGLGETFPKRDKHEFALLDRVLSEHDFPVLGICRGMQVMNVFFGGTTYQALEHEKPDGIMHFLFKTYPFDYPAHAVHLEAGSKIAQLYGKERLQVNSFHHQAVKGLGRSLRATAHADDEIVEALQLDGERFVAGVQWHPEMMVDSDEDSLAFFQSYVKKCSRCDVG